MNEIYSNELILVLKRLTRAVALSGGIPLEVLKSDESAARWLKDQEQIVKSVSFNPYNSTWEEGWGQKPDQKKVP